MTDFSLKATPVTIGKEYQTFLLEIHNGSINYNFEMKFRIKNTDRAQTMILYENKDGTYVECFTKKHFSDVEKMQSRFESGHSTVINLAGSTIKVSTNSVTVNGLQFTGKTTTLFSDLIIFLKKLEAGFDKARNENAMEFLNTYLEQVKSGDVSDRTKANRSLREFYTSDFASHDFKRSFENVLIKQADL